MDSQKRIRIVGSTALYGFSTSVAERFGKLSIYKTPLVEANGTGGGFKIFCGSNSKRRPDAVNASRAIEKSEREFCRSQGVTDLQELIIGHDGIILAAHKDAQSFPLTLSQIAKALVKEVRVEDEWVPNPHQKWSDIDSQLPNKRIKIMGPPPSSGTYAVLIDLILKPECRDKNVKCLSLRSDGAYIQASEHENVIAQKLISNPNKLAIFSYSFLKQHKEKLRAVVINGKSPTRESIRDKTYPLSRALYVYASRRHLKNTIQLRQFLQSFYEPRAIGPWGYLTLKGLVPTTKVEKSNAAKVLK